MNEINTLSFDEDKSPLNNGPYYGSIDDTNHSKPSKRTSLKMAIGHQPCHQLEVSHRASTASQNTTESQLLTRRALFYDEMKSMIQLAIPVTLTYFFEMLPGITIIMLVGKAEVDSDDESAEEISLQKLHMDAAAVATLFMNIVALSPGFGMLTAMDTLCSQAHGANQSSKMGTYALTGLIIVSILFLMSGTILWYATPILIMLGQPVEVSNFAGVFARYLIPGIPFSFVYELIRKTSQARNEAMPMLISAIVCNVVTIAVGYYLVYCTGWGWLGAGIARSVGEVVLVPAILISMVMGWGGDEGSNDKAKSLEEQLELVNKSVNERCDSDLVEDDREFLQQLVDGFIISDAMKPSAIIEFLSLGIPGMLQVMFEWCAFECIALLCGLLEGEKAIIGIGANAVIMNFSSVAYMFYLGIGVSGNTRIGNAIGAGDIRRAKNASYVTYLLGTLMSFVNITILLTFRKSIPWLITSDIDIVSEAQHLLVVAAVFQIPDAINACNQGIFRSIGRQTLAAKLNFVAYYIIGIPLGYVLGVQYFDLGVSGLWIGMTVGLLAISLSGTILVLKSDWITVIDEANERLG